MNHPVNIQLSSFLSLHLYYITFLGVCQEISKTFLKIFFELFYSLYLFTPILYIIFNLSTMDKMGIFMDFLGRGRPRATVWQLVAVVPLLGSVTYCHTITRTPDNQISFRDFLSTLFRYAKAPNISPVSLSIICNSFSALIGAPMHLRTL